MNEKLPLFIYPIVTRFKVLCLEKISSETVVKFIFGRYESRLTIYKKF